MRPRPILSLALLLVLVAPLAGAGAQVRDSSAAAAARGDRTRVFLDCQAPYCDFDYFRTEITFVDYVRDRRDSDVHLLLTAQQTGGGGWEFTLAFLGQGEHAGRDQTLRYVSRGTDIEDDVRSGLARVIKLGLVPYVAATPIAERLEVSLAEEPEGTDGPATPADDPWNLWSFRIGLSGGLDGEQSAKSYNTSGSISATRVTEMWKINITGRGFYHESSFEVTLEDSSLFTLNNYQHDYESNVLVVRSVGGQWAAGAQLTARGSTRENQRLTIRLAPAIEANYFPYAESTRRLLTVRYSVGASAYQYRDTTIYFKTDEVIPEHSLLIGYSATQPWGSVNFSGQASQALNNSDLYRLTAGGSGEFRLFRGFSLNVFGSYARINDQVYLPKAGATVEEVLLRQRQLATDYRYFGSLGISYRFGSIFQNIVNPRFGSSGFFFFF